MSDETKVRALLAPLLERPVDITGTELAVDREQVVQAILRAGREGAAAPGAGRQLGWWLAAAAGVLLVGGAAALLHSRQPVAESKTAPTLASPQRAEPGFVVDGIRGSVTRSEGGSMQVLKANANAPRLTPASELWTGPSSGADLWRDDGFRIELSENTRVSLSGLRAGLEAKALQLLTGSIKCRAGAPNATADFSVITPNAVVLVRAALFSIDVERRGESATSCVRVETGQVVVEVAGGKQLLPAGSSWGCDAAQPGEPSARSAGLSARALSGEPKPARSREAGSPMAPGGTLDEENRLFQAGLSNERNGDARAATESFRTLLTRYPKSPLAGDAKRALERVARTPSRP